MIDRENLLVLADDIKSTIHERQEQTVFDYKVYSICSQVQALLKEQEAVKPNISHGTWWFQCGKCKMQIDYGDKFCRRCGQAAKWE